MEVSETHNCFTRLVNLRVAHAAIHFRVADRKSAVGFTASPGSCSAFNLDVSDWRYSTAFLQDYENLGEIGEGTYGTVIKARHLGTGLVVAIKQFKESDEDDQVSADEL